MTATAVPEASCNVQRPATSAAELIKRSQEFQQGEVFSSSFSKQPSCSLRRPPTPLPPRQGPRLEAFCLRGNFRRVLENKRRLGQKSLGSPQLCYGGDAAPWEPLGILRLRSAFGARLFKNCRAPGRRHAARGPGARGALRQPLAVAVSRRTGLAHLAPCCRGPAGRDHFQLQEAAGRWLCQSPFVSRAPNPPGEPFRAASCCVRPGSRCSLDAAPALPKLPEASPSPCRIRPGSPAATCPSPGRTPRRRLPGA